MWRPVFSRTTDIEMAAGDRCSSPDADRNRRRARYPNPCPSAHSASAITAAVFSSASGFSGMLSMRCATRTQATGVGALAGTTGESERPRCPPRGTSRGAQWRSAGSRSSVPRLMAASRPASARCRPCPRRPQVTRSLRSPMSARPFLDAPCGCRGRPRWAARSARPLGP